MEEQTIVITENLSIAIEKYVNNFNLEVTGSHEMVLNYMGHLKTYGSWEEVRFRCLRIERLIAKHLENNNFTERDFIVVQRFAELVYKYRGVKEEEYQWEMFTFFLTILRAYDMGDDVEFESLRCVFDMAKCGTSYLCTHADDVAVKDGVEEYLQILSRLLVKECDMQREKYGYKLVKLYKEVTLNSADPSDWLFELLLRYGQLVTVVSQGEESNKKRLINKCLALVDILMGKVKGLDKELAKADKKMKKREKKEIQRRINHWARGVVHLCHFVHSLYDEKKAKRQNDEMQKAMDNAIEIRKEREYQDIFKKEESKALRSLKNKHNKEDNKTDDEKKQAKEEALKKAMEEAEKRWKEKISSPTYVAPFINDKEILGYVQQYMEAQTFGDMFEQCEDVLNCLKKLKSPIEKEYIYGMTKLMTDLAEWAAEYKVKKSWQKKLDAMEEYCTDVTPFRVFYGETASWSLKKERKVLNK